MWSIDHAAPWSRRPPILRRPAPGGTTLPLLLTAAREGRLWSRHQLVAGARGGSRAVRPPTLTPSSIWTRRRHRARTLHAVRLVALRGDAREGQGARGADLGPRGLRRRARVAAPARPEPVRGGRGMSLTKCLPGAQPAGLCRPAAPADLPPDRQAQFRHAGPAAPGGRAGRRARSVVRCRARAGLPPRDVPRRGRGARLPLIWRRGWSRATASSRRSCAGCRAERRDIARLAEHAPAGPVEFDVHAGRAGNPARRQRDVLTRSTQNRIGLRNPGAAAVFLGARRDHRRRPDQHRGRPRRDDPDQQTRKCSTGWRSSPAGTARVVHAQTELSQHRGRPAQPQTADEARQVCGRRARALAVAGVPLWVRSARTCPTTVRA